MGKSNDIRISDEDLQKFYSPGNWFMFPKDFLMVMTEMEAILLSYLINHSVKVDAIEKADGWFYCKKRRMTKELLYPSDRLRYLVSKLKNKNFLSIKWKGLPAKRYFKINANEIFLACKAKIPEIRKFLEKENIIKKKSVSSEGNGFLP
jgi:hypothetical protein